VRVGSVEIDDGIYVADDEWIDAIPLLLEITDEDINPIEDEPIEVLVFVDTTVVVFVNDVLFE